MGTRSLTQYAVLVCVGSGGVGKTTTAAALALSAAAEGKRVLCLTVDPARRLANSLGLSEMTTEAKEIEPALFEEAGLEVTGSLTAMMLDPKRTFDELVRRYASSDEVRDRIFANKIYEYVSSSLAGTSEYMAMEKLHAVRESSEWDLIVVDTPPAANAIDFLEAPERMVRLVDSPAMRWFVQAFGSSGKFSFNLLSKGAALVFKGLARFTGGDFLNVLAEFVRDLNDLFGGFQERAKRVSGTLRSDDVGFVIVASPHRLSVDEAVALSNKLKESDLKTRAVVVNGVHQQLPEPPKASVAVPKLESLLSEPARAKKLWKKMRRSYDDLLRRSLADRTQIDRLKAAVDNELLVEVPALAEDVHDLAALHQVAQFLTGASFGKTHAETSRNPS